MSWDSNRLVLISLGSNLGDSGAILDAALNRIQQWSSAPLSRSSFWRSEPIDCPPGSPWFVNAAVGFEAAPEETPESLLAKLQNLELEFGRLPKRKYHEPRTLDLDLIAFGHEIRETPFLILPHPRAAVRGFVLRPLAEIAPGFRLPGQSKTIAELLKNFGAAQTVTKVTKALLANPGSSI